MVLGSGNVATHLARALDKDHHVVQVYSRDKTHAALLSEKLTGCEATDKLDRIYTDADIYIISVSDDAIRYIVASMPEVKGMVVHTSGSVGLEVLEGIGGSTGVFYPLQTFSKDIQVDIHNVPFFLEASDEQGMQKMESVASGLSNKIYHADSEQRLTLHIGAVFACNFLNHLLDISSEILTKKGYSLEVLAPLIEVTISKALESGAHESQTGPAVRGDINTIHKHMESLHSMEREIYHILSQSIIDRYKIQKRI